MNLPPEKREQWDADLTAPLPWEKASEVKPSEAQVEAEGAMFMAAMAQHATQGG